MMDTGSIATAAIAAAIAFGLFLGIKRIVRNFAGCCCSGGCSGCCGCHAEAERTKAFSSEEK